VRPTQACPCSSPCRVAAAAAGLSPLFEACLHAKSSMLKAACTLTCNAGSSYVESTLTKLSTNLP